MKPKKELLRIVKEVDGTVSVDSTGKKNGRGAYLCADSECFAKAKKKRGLERAFSCRVDYEQLTASWGENENIRNEQG